jgi:hypothetical protein
MVTLMGIAARTHGIDLNGLSFSLEKHMANDPRRIGSVPISIQMPADLSSKDRLILERAAMTCPVHKSLPAELEREVKFVYPEEA